LGQTGARIAPDLKNIAFALFIFALGFTGGPQFFANIGRGLRKHRSYRREQLELELPKRRRTLEESHSSHPSQALRIHDSASYLCHRQLGSRGNRIDHDSRQGSLPELTGEKAKQKVVLVRLRS